MTAPSRTEQPTLHDVLGAPLPPAPAYGSNSIADVLESASSLVAQRSLARPAHALDSDPAFNSVADPLNLAGRLAEQDVDPASFRHACVVMVDGLGEQLINSYGGYAPEPGPAGRRVPHHDRRLPDLVGYRYGTGRARHRRLRGAQPGR